MASAYGLPTSEHFTLERVAEGVYAAISIGGTGSMSNSGIVDLGDRTLLLDTMFTPQAAEDLRAAAERLTGRAATLVVNSHMHGDHVHGNQVFSEAEVIATRRTRELIETRTAVSIEEQKQDPEGSTAFFREGEERMAKEPDERKRAQMARELASWRLYVASVPTLIQRLPNISFESSLTIHGTRRTAELLTFGGGHTDSDAFLYLPQERIAFMGDLLFTRAHPWMGHGHPEEWIRILERIEQMDIQTAVSGHGPIGTLRDCALLRGYIADIMQVARLAMRDGKSAEEASTAIPPAYAEWDDADVFSWNMTFLYEYLPKQDAAQQNEKR
jgi:glyoxylase-like metal-dependent hydrolase (beta-lactamase superfamily II)